MPSFLAAHPKLQEVVLSLAILAGSYLAARILSFFFTKVLATAASRTATTLDDQLVTALKRPLTWSLFLVGAYVAVHRLPAGPRWIVRLDAVLFVFGVFLVTVALVRSYSILLAWYTTEIRPADSLATEFGPLFRKTGRLVIALVALITTLQHFDINVASLVVSLGVGSLAVGLAAQDTLSNMFAGFTLLLDRPFRVGDRIQLSTGEVGDVEGIGIRATRIRTVDETLLVVPNSALTKERLVNQSRPGRQITTRVELAVAYGSDLRLVKRILAESVAATELADHDHPPTVVVTRFGDGAVHLLLAFWATDYRHQGLARGEVHEEVYRRLAEAGIEIAVPIRRVLGAGPDAPAPKEV